MQQIAAFKTRVGYGDRRGQCVSVDGVKRVRHAGANGIEICGLWPHYFACERLQYFICAANR